MPEELFVSETMISELSVNRYGKLNEYLPT